MIEDSSDISYDSDDQSETFDVAEVHHSHSGGSPDSASYSSIVEHQPPTWRYGSIDSTSGRRGHDLHRGEASTGVHSDLEAIDDHLDDDTQELIGVAGPLGVREQQRKAGFFGQLFGAKLSDSDDPEV